MNLLFDEALELISKTDNEAVAIFKRAKIFLIDNVVDSMNISMKDLVEKLPSIAPPYPVMWFEWTLDGERLGTLMTSARSTDGGWTCRYWFFSDCFGKQKDVKIVAYFLDIFVPASGKLSITPEGKLRIGFTEFPFAVKQSFGDNLVMSPETPEETMKTLYQLYLVFVLFAIGLMHCKNIVQIEKGGKRPEIKNRRHRNKGTVHYVLDVVPARHIKRTEYEHPGHGSPQRIHFRRGHFKEYTAERPLFGKHTGTFWWEAHVAGSAEIGKVEKEYRILPKQE